MLCPSERAGLVARLHAAGFWLLGQDGAGVGSQQWAAAAHLPRTWEWRVGRGLVAGWLTAGFWLC